MSEKMAFDQELIFNYPKANKKLTVEVRKYSIGDGIEEPEQKGFQTTFISPFGAEILGTETFPDGTLVKVEVNMPDYWARKQRLVDYSRVDNPGKLKFLGKIVRSVELGKRGKKKQFVVETVNIDEIDEKVLKSFLEDLK